MSQLIPINLVAEDELSGFIAARLLVVTGRNFSARSLYSRGGNGYIRKQFRAFNSAAQYCPYFILTDLDSEPCPILYLNKLLNGAAKSENLIARIVVKEAESWIMADRERFAEFVGVSRDVVPAQIEQLADVKQALLGVVRRSNSRTLREAILPRAGGTALVGPDYNGCLIRFVQSHWRVQEARLNSDSLDRTMRALEQLRYP